MTPFVGLGDLSTQLGESPVWDDRRNLVFLCDIAACQIHAVDLSQGLRQSWTFGSKVGSLGLCESGRLVVALTHTVILFDPDSNAQNELAAVVPLPDGCRLNDGKVGPDGCFWVGSMDDRADKEPVAALYRVTAEGTSIKVADGLTVSNGLAWSADGRTMFHSDSRQRFIAAYDFDPHTSTMSNRRVLRTMTDAEGRPDGAACDAEGYYWSAGVSAGRLNRIAPDGTIERQVALPAPAPTMPCFGGTDLRTMYVTSLQREGQDPGSLFELDVGIAGAPIARFGEPLTF